MASKTVEITIDADGQITFEMDGFQGKGCGELTKKLTKEMQATVISNKKKAEYYKPEVEQKQKIRRM